MPEIGTVESLARAYDASTWLKPLLELVPGGVGSSANTWLESRIRQIERDRLHTFFDTLANGRVQLTTELVDSEDFLHAFFATVRAARRTRNRQKIRFLAHLLVESADGLQARPDQFERHLGIIDELAFEELEVLAIIASYERCVQTVGNVLQRTNTYWPDLVQELARVLQVPAEAVDGFLTRLARSGCFQPIAGGFWDYTGGHGTLTPLYYKLERVAKLYRTSRS